MNHRGIEAEDDREDVVREIVRERAEAVVLSGGLDGTLRVEIEGIVA